MARHDMNTMMTTSQMVAALAVQPFQALFDALVRIAENSPRMKALDALNAMSDEDLSARGLTRAQAAQQILRTSL